VTQRPVSNNIKEKETLSGDVKVADDKIMKLVRQVNMAKKSLVSGRIYRRVERGLERAGKDFEKLKDKNEDKVLHSKLKQSIVPKNEELRSIENTLIFYIYMRFTSCPEFSTFNFASKVKILKFIFEYKFMRR
jgi:hypothetical protein